MSFSIVSSFHIICISIWNIIIEWHLLLERKSHTPRLLLNKNGQEFSNCLLNTGFPNILHSIGTSQIMEAEMSMLRLLPVLPEQSDSRWCWHCNKVAFVHPGYLNGQHFKGINLISSQIVGIVTTIITRWNITNSENNSQ